LVMHQDGMPDEPHAGASQAPVCGATEEEGMGQQGQTQAVQGLGRLGLLGLGLLGLGLILWWGWATPVKTPPPPANPPTTVSPPAIPPTTAAPPAVPPAVQEARHLVDVGNKRFRAHDVAGATEAFTKAIELDPQLSLAYYARAK